MKVVVLAGGLSPERDVSLSSGALIANALIENGHSVFLLDLLIGTDKKFEELSFLTKDSIDRYEYIIPPEEPNFIELHQKYPDQIGKGVLSICKQADVVFIALHGSIGENGQLQSIFEMQSIKHTRSSYFGCMLAMDKDISKKIATIEGISTAKWKTYSLSEVNFDTIKRETKIPCVVKPLSCGSSIGISIVKTEEELLNALRVAKKYEDSILIEDMIKGREVSCGIVGDKALPVIEIIPKSGFYDYKNKYQKGLSNEICPAEIDRSIEKTIQAFSYKMHKALRLGYYSRSDFIIRDNEEIVYLETNTLPGMTPTSLLPQEARVSGITYNELCNQIVHNAIKIEG